jgi:putative membrane protein
MAWIRTATSLITFGFSLYKFFEFDIVRREAATAGWITPRGAGIALIAAGLISLTLGLIEHRAAFTRMRAEFGTGAPSSAGVVAAIVCLMGLAAFVAALFRA